MHGSSPAGHEQPERSAGRPGSRVGAGGVGAGGPGSRVSAMLVSLAEGERGPGHAASPASATRWRGQGAERVDRPEVFAGWAQTTFPAVATRLSRLVTNLRLFDHVAPIFNLVVSNVPGPDVPLLPGRGADVAIFPLGPIIEGVGVNVTVFSYLDTMYVGVQGCWDLVPDVEVIARGMEDALAGVGGRSQSQGPAGALVARRTPCVGRVRSPTTGRRTDASPAVWVPVLRPVRDRGGSGARTANC